MTRHALVVGAGLAGLTAAMDLVDGGWQVTLAERRPFPGGRTFSFTNEAGDTLDNGQHVFLGCCTAYLALLERLGQRGQVFLQRRLDVRIVDASGRAARLRERPLPAPLHLLPSFLAFPYLSAAEKLAALGALLSMRLRALPEDESFAAWLGRHGQSRNAIQRLWDLITIPTCNAPSARVSAAQGGFVFREGLLRTSWGGRIGYPRLSLSDIVPERAAAYLRERGADLRFGAAIQRLTDAGAETTRGERLLADAYVVAVPAHELGAVVSEPWAEPAARLEHAPIVGINLWYDGPLFDGEVLAAIVDGETFWLFDRTRILGLDGPLHHVAVSISAAEAAVERPRSELASEVAAKLAKVLPAATPSPVPSAPLRAGAAREGMPRQAPALVRSSVEKVRAATFVPGPGSPTFRLGARTPWPNVFLAGSWTATGWPDTMEGAIRSGHTAARLAQDLVQEARH